MIYVAILFVCLGKDCQVITRPTWFEDKPACVKLIGDVVEKLNKQPETSAQGYCAQIWPPDKAKK